MAGTRRAFATPHPRNVCSGRPPGEPHGLPGRPPERPECARDPRSCSRPASRTATRPSTAAAPRVDEMEKCGHYERWREDFDLRAGARRLVPALRPADPPHLAGARALRLGLRRRDLRRSAPARRRADRRPVPFRRARLDRQLPEPRLPRALRRATPAPSRERFPWVQLYTPVNEMFICATFSAALRLVERAADDATAPSSPRSSTSSRPTCWPCSAILEVRPDAIFIQSESSEYFHADDPAAIKPAEIAERAALPVARPQLRPARRLGDVRVPAGQRHDARRVPLLPRQPPEAPLHHGQRLLRDQRAPRRRATAARGPRARSSATTRSPGSTTTATACR